MKLANKFQYCFYPNSNRIGIFVDKELFENKIYFITTIENIKKSIKNQDLIKAILAIPGIIQITLNDKYSFSIEKGKAFDWEEIIPKVVKEYRKFIGMRKKIEIIETKDI